MDNVWNVYNHQKAPDKKYGKFQNSFITDDNRKPTISRNSYRNLNYNFPKITLT